MIKIEWADYVSRLGWSELAGVENSGAVCGDWLGCCSWCRRPMSRPPYPMSHVPCWTFLVVAFWVSHAGSHQLCGLRQQILIPVADRGEEEGVLRLQLAATAGTHV
jgi:hypothetical protein